jgi:hypothetical protein
MLNMTVSFRKLLPFFKLFENSFFTCNGIYQKSHTSRTVGSLAFRLSSEHVYASAITLHLKSKTL